MIIPPTPMEQARSRETVAAAMRRFAAADSHPVRRRDYAAIAQRPSTFGAGEPLAPVRPTRSRHVELEHIPKSWLKIIDEVCVRHRLHRKDVLAGWKSVEAVACRQEIWAELRTRTGASLQRIGRRTGGFHHTTVMHGLAQRAAKLASVAEK